MSESDLFSGVRPKGQSESFRAIYRDYLRQLAELDLSDRAARLKCALQSGEDTGEKDSTESADAAPELLIPLFGLSYGVSSQGIRTPSGETPLHAESVLLSRYVLLAPLNPPRQEDWLAFKDFRDAAPFAGAFSVQVEKALADDFSGRAEALEGACNSLQGEETDLDLTYTLCREFPALPGIRLLLLFNDRDEEFPAEAKILFPDNAAAFLDMECLAILGWLLKDFLRLASGGTGTSIM